MYYFTIALIFGLSAALCTSYSPEDHRFMLSTFLRSFYSPNNMPFAVFFSLHRNEYLCFQKVMKGDYITPNGFPDQGTDLVKSLLVRS